MRLNSASLTRMLVQIFCTKCNVTGFRIINLVYPPIVFKTVTRLSRYRNRSVGLACTGTCIVLYLLETH